MAYGVKRRGNSLRNLVAALAVVGSVFVGYYSAAGLDTFTPKPIKSEKSVVKQERKQSLEDIINSSQKIVMKATYEVNYTTATGKEAKKEISTYGFGSSICVYKNLDENNLFFLTCSHVISPAKEMYFFSSQTSLKKIEKNMYEVTIKNEDKDISFYTLLSSEEENSTPPWLIQIQIAKLKKVDVGIYQDTVKDYNGNIKEFKTVPLEVLADTKFDFADPDALKNNDIALLRVDSSKINKYDLYSQLSKFSAWTGKWADFSSMKQGDVIKVVGYPLAFERQINSGELTSKEGMEFGDNFYFTSAHVNRGNSGGPAFLVIEKYKLQDGQIIKEQEFLFAGLTHIDLLPWGAQGMGGVLRPDIIQDFLREQGYGYLIK